MYSFKPICFIINKINAYIKESNGNKHSTLTPADRNNGTRKNTKNEDDKYYP